VTLTPRPAGSPNLTAMTEAAGAEGGPCQCAPCLARAQAKRLRAWRWITGLDLTKPPAPLIRWALLLILGLCCWAAGIPLVIRDWLGPIIIAGALILRDVAGFGIAGIRLYLREAKDELAALKLRIEMRQEVNFSFPMATVEQATTGSDQIRVIRPSVLVK
jgi:hypothetical protein